MRTIVALTRRELGVYFVSPMAYVIVTCLMFIFGLFFTYQARVSAEANQPFVYAGLFEIMSIMVAVIAPLVTMRLLAEEKNRGTIETLMTAPVREAQVVLAKYLASLGFLLFLFLPTLAHAILVSKYGTLDVSETFAGYLGLFLLAASLFSIGLFISSICTSQVTAGVLTFAVTLLLVFTAIVAGFIPQQAWWGKAAVSVISTMNPFPYLLDFTRGIIDTRPIVYYLTLIVFFLFMAIRALESRRWR